MRKKSKKKVLDKLSKNYIEYQYYNEPLCTHVIGLNHTQILLDRVNLIQVVVDTTLNKINKLLKNKKIAFVEYRISICQSTQLNMKEKVLKSSQIHETNKNTEEMINKLFQELNDNYKEYITDIIEIKIKHYKKEH